ncbi:hypothetical protein O7599_10750 [Streptomyces sp. WMMC500]|uniref:hypothetical protein n=1 Tax=Streptomyces sp. WMMC500 TaxID=3015154 RepID=UPI00248C6516|nr:hypothetical protein [Streptomyces sp. WMMC500]WBB62969.1 hypothetical protein O7599_10750 [Streptomyces sp. WMMC500]
MVSLLCAFGLVAGAGSAQADAPIDRETDAGADDQEIWARTGGGIQFSGAVEDEGQGPGNLAPATAGWNPPPCWYAPYLGAKDFKRATKKSIEEQMAAPGMTGHAGSALQQLLDHYEDGYSWPNHPGFQDWNVKNDGEGKFWAGVENPAEEDVLARGECSEVPFWVDNGEPAPAWVADQAIDPAMLAELAYERMVVPDTEAELRPEGEQTVNLPTWVWLDGARFQPVTARATVPALGMWAETTATPVSLTIEPGTDDAELHPDGGECAMNEDGAVGTPYRKGDADRMPPCGVTYLRSSESTGPYDFTASVTWRVTWSASDGTTDEQLPTGIVEATQELEVQEIQSIVR